MKEIKRYDINVADEIFEVVHNGDWIKSKDVTELITDHKSVVETMQKRIDKLKAEKKEFCDLLVNPYDYSDREGDEIIERAEEIIKESE